MVLHPINISSKEAYKKTTRLTHDERYEFLRKKCKQETKNVKANLLYPNMVPRSQTITFGLPASLTFSAEFTITCKTHVTIKAENYFMW